MATIRCGPTTPRNVLLTLAGSQTLKADVGGRNKMRALRADITTLRVDAIVNAANATLLGGGGVDGAIHRAAGAQLLNACRLLGGCAVGDAKITPGFRLPARFVIHTVGPVWQGGGADESKQLANCYRRCMELAVQNGVKTLAFPSISTGVYGYPIDEASKIAVTTVNAFLNERGAQVDVIFCCFSERDLTAYSRCGVPTSGAA